MAFYFYMHEIIKVESAALPLPVVSPARERLSCPISLGRTSPSEPTGTASLNRRSIHSPRDQFRILEGLH